MRVSRYWATGLAIIGSVLCSTTALAVAGDVDAAYGSSGYFISTIGDSARGSVMQPDGKLLLAASCPQRAPATGKTFCISRLTTTGALDSTFGTSGRAIVQAGDTNSIAEQAIKIAVQPDGKIVVGGECSSGSTIGSCVVRLLGNGTLDSTFGTGGKVFLSGLRFFGAVTTTSTSKVLVAGGCGGGFVTITMCISRLNADGTADSAFGTSGTYTFPALNGGANDVAMAMAVRTDGRIAVAGRCTTNALAASKACIGMVTAAGVPDASLLGQSLALVTFLDNSNTHNSLEAIAWRSDGALISAGRCKRANGTYGVCYVYFNASALPSSMQQVQLTASGDTFGIGSDPDVYYGMVDVDVLPDGRTLMAFPSNVTVSTASFAFYLFDTSFGLLTGAQTDPRAGLNLPWAGVTVQPNGQFLVSGSCYATGSQTPNACVTRFQGFPTPARTCSLDIDGDGSFTATTDGLISTRVMLGLTGSAAIGGISFPVAATRNTWPLIRDFLVGQCGMALP